MVRKITVGKQLITAIGAVLLSLYFSACDDTRFKGSRAILIVNTDEVDFGQVPIRLLVSRNITLTNAGDQPLEVFSISLESNADRVFFVEETSIEIDPGRQAGLKIGFGPTEVKASNALLVLRSNSSSGKTHEVKLLGTGIPDEICGDCNNPPAAYCSTEFELIYYDHDGFCVDGKCHYQAHQITCLYRCEEGRCTELPPDGCDFSDADSGVEPSGDEGVDAGGDEGVDAGGDEGVDAGGDEGVDAGGDKGVDAGGDEGVDAGGDDMEYRCGPLEQCNWTSEYFSYAHRTEGVDSPEECRALCNSYPDTRCCVWTDTKPSYCTAWYSGDCAGKWQNNCIGDQFWGVICD